MTRTDEHNSGQAATRRAEQTLDNLGYHLGLLAGTATHRIEQVVNNVHLSSPFQTSTTQQETDRSLQSSQEATQPTFERAEDLVQRAEQNIGRWTARVGQQSQRMVARMREDLEDMWADAQHLRRSRRHT
jgi:small-conductance mechanosensitive channel